MWKLFDVQDVLQTEREFSFRKSIPDRILCQTKVFWLDNYGIYDQWMAALFSCSGESATSG